MKRLAIVATHPVQYFAPLYRRLARRPNLEIEVLFASRAGAEPYFDEEFGKSFGWDIPILEGYPHRFLGDSTADPRKARVPIGAALARGEYDGALIPGYTSAIEMRAIMACRRLGIPIFLRPEGNDETSSRGWFRSLIRRRILRSLYRRVDKYLAIGEVSREHFLSNGGDPGKVIFSPYSVDNEFFEEQEKKLPAKESLRKELGFEGCDVVLLFCGKLVRKKDPLLIGRALSRCHAAGKWGLLVVGDGELREPMEEQLKALAHVKTVFAGFQNQSAISRYYGAADILLLPSRFGETWGLVVNEAMNFGLPAVVSSRVGCRRDLVVEGKTGYTFEAGDPEQLADRILRLSATRLSDWSPVIRSHIAEYSLERAVQGICAAADPTQTAPRVRSATVR